MAGDELGTSGSNSSRLNVPTDVYITDDNMIYVLDALNRRVQLFLPNSTTGTTVVNRTFRIGVNQYTYSKFDTVSNYLLHKNFAV